MALMWQEMECWHCAEAGEVETHSTRLEMQVTKNGIVQFKVECDQCGNFSHYLEYNEINRAIKRYIDKRVLIPAVQSV